MLTRKDEVAMLPQYGNAWHNTRVIAADISVGSRAGIFTVGTAG